MSLDVILSYEQVESLISEINMGGRMVSINDSSGHPRLLFLAHCVGVDKLRAEYEYKLSYERAIEDGYMTAAETRAVLESRGHKPSVTDEDIRKQEQKIRAQEAYLAKLTRVPSRRKETIDNLKRMREALDEMFVKKEDGLEHSAERAALETKLSYMCWRAARNPDTLELIWPTRESFNNEKDLIFRGGLFGQVLRLSRGFDVPVLRYIARSNIWRIRYLNAVKTGASLFGSAVSEYTVDQLALSYWSQYYQSIYEMLPEDKPPEDIIEDDAALDAFMQSYMEELSREATASRESKKSGSGVKNAWSHGETIVTRSNELYSELQYSETVESIRNKSKSDLKVKNPKHR